MKLVRCIRKHFFDSDKFDECPHCEEMTEAEKKATMPNELKKQEAEKEARNKKDFNEPRRRPIIDDEFAEIGMTNSMPQPTPPPPPPQSSPPPVQSAPPPVPQEHKPAQQGSLQSLVSAAVADKPSAPEDMKTVAFYDYGDTDPVVGWLVCTDGEYFGQSFNLKLGANFIGRAMTMDIPLAKDGKVSRDRHATITYEPNERMFFVEKGESRNLTYFNGKVLLEPREIKKGDKIKVGATELLFVPLCGEDFSWDDV